jgi:hypothetical protein
MPTLVIVHEDPTGDPFNDGPRCRYHVLDRDTGREWAGVESFEFHLRRHWDRPLTGVFQAPSFATVARGTVRLRGDAKFETNDVEIQWIAGGRAACALCQKGA